jgi:peptide/nickel transport system permease protein
MATTTTDIPQALPAARQKERARGWRKMVQILFANQMAVIGIAIVLFWVALAALAPLIAPYDPVGQDLKNRLHGPGIAGHLLGVDGLGRDVLSRVMYGGRITLPVSFSVVILATIFGTIYGGVAGFIGGWFDDVTMRIVDMVLAFPSLILAMAIAAALGPSIWNAMLAMLLVWWPPYARLARGQVLALRHREYVTAARTVGADDRRILFSHILPNAYAPLLVLMTVDFGNAVIITAALSFLGLGAVPPTPEWGAMVSEGRELIAQWWISTFPGLAIFTVSVGCNFIGDGLRDAIDPRLRVR